MTRLSRRPNVKPSLFVRLISQYLRGSSNSSNCSYLILLNEEAYHIHHTTLSNMVHMYIAYLILMPCCKTTDAQQIRTIVEIRINADQQNEMLLPEQRKPLLSCLHALTNILFPSFRPYTISKNCHGIQMLASKHNRTIYTFTLHFLSQHATRYSTL